MSTTVKGKIEIEEGITHTISEINVLEYEMRRGASALFSTTLNDLFRRTASADSSEKKTVSSTKRVDVEALNSVYGGLIKKFEELERFKYGPLRYIEQMDIYVPNNIAVPDNVYMYEPYGIDLIRTSINLISKNLDVSDAYRRLPLPRYLQHTPHNRALAKEIVDAIVEELKKNARLVMDLKRTFRTFQS